TGEVIATVNAPPGWLFMGPSGSADDRTFAVTAVPIGPAPPVVAQWYLLRLAPGTAGPARLTRLPLPPTPQATGFALSPDGRELAVALRYSPGGPQLLRLYSVATGAVLRTWSTTSSEITRVPASNAGASMRWTADGRGLAFILRGPAAKGTY